MLCWCSGKVSIALIDAASKLNHTPYTKCKWPIHDQAPQTCSTDQLLDARLVEVASPHIRGPHASRSHAVDSSVHQRAQSSGIVTRVVVELKW